jgi:hypothetical protein
MRALLTRALLAAAAASAEDALLAAERVRSPQELAWCSGALATSSAPNASDARYTGVDFLVRASAFPDVELTELVVGVTGWDAAAGHLAVVSSRPAGRARAGAPEPAITVLHSGSPRGVTFDAITMALGRAPPVRESALVSVRLLGGATLAAAAGAAGKLDDGGLVLVAGACSNESAAVPCSPAALLVRYDAECSAPARKHVLLDALRVSRVGSSEAQLVSDRLVAALRDAYALSPGDDLLVTDRSFERWLGASMYLGALRFEYMVRSERALVAADGAQLDELARAAGVASVTRSSPAPGARTIVVASMLACAGAASACAVSARARVARKAAPKGAVEVLGVRGAYQRSLVI